MAALAIAEQMRRERLGRVEAESERRSTYDAIPIGLFTLNTNGAFLRGNPALRTPLRFIRFEPVVVPKHSLTGVDDRVE